jgi:hypothetical protein
MKINSFPLAPDLVLCTFLFSDLLNRLFLAEEVLVLQPHS